MPKDVCDTSKSYYYPEVAREGLFNKLSSGTKPFQKLMLLLRQEGHGSSFLPLRSQGATWSSECGRGWRRRGQVKESYLWEPSKSWPAGCFFFVVSSSQQALWTWPLNCLLFISLNWNQNYFARNPKQWTVIELNIHSLQIFPLG